jgi:hypothetical protein
MPNTLDGILLLGWMEKSEAISYLLEHCWFDPPLTNGQAESMWDGFRKTVEELPERQISSPARHPIPNHSQAWVGRFKTATRGPEVLDVINVNPMGLVVYQFYVAVGRSDQHAQNVGTNRWTQTSLQIERPGAALPIRGEDGVIKVALPHPEHGFVVRPDGLFQIQQGGGFVSVCEVEGRMVLKAGYHRSFAFARSTMNEPDARDKSLLVALTATAPPQLSPLFPTQGLRTTVLGPRAPLFADFFDNSLAIRVKLRRKRYEMHLRVELKQIDDL